MKIQEYRLKSDHHTYRIDTLDTKVIKAGSFVKPLDIRWVPIHITEDPKNKDFNNETEVFCFCREGIIRFKRDNIVEAY